MFSRRNVQLSVERLATVLSAKQVTDLVRRLNTPALAQVAAEWEAVVLAAIAGSAELRHESDFGGPSRPDIHAVFARHGVEFVADVRTVSDKDYEVDNPVEFFQQQMYASARALGLSGAGLFLDVERAEVTDKKQRRLLALPEKSEVQDFVRTHVRPFLEVIAANPSVDRHWRYDDRCISVAIRFSAKEKTISGGGWPTYNWPRTNRHNPLYRALEEKAVQLKRSGYSGMKGVIVCDAGCETLVSACDRVMKAFFEQHRSTVTFVATIHVPDERRRDGERRYRYPELRLFWNPRHDRSKGLLIERALRDVLLGIPPATSASRYARNRDFSPNLRYRDSFEGGYMVMGGKCEVIKVSARAVLEALAGNIREFGPKHRSVPVEIFAAQLREGRTIRSARLERSEHDDDDWVVLELDGPDAAISPYAVPDSVTDSSTNSGST